LIAQAGIGGGEAVMASRPKSNIEVTMLQTFNREIGKILGFLMVCRLYIRIKIRDISVEEQM